MVAGVTRKTTCIVLFSLLLLFPVSAQSGGAFDAAGFLASKVWYEYPAFEHIFRIRKPGFSMRIPVGVLGLLRPNANPSLYVLDRARFRTDFDFLY